MAPAAEESPTSGSVSITLNILAAVLSMRTQADSPSSIINVPRLFIASESMVLGLTDPGIIISGSGATP